MNMPVSNGLPTNELERAAIALVISEARSLDQRDWQDWLDLYAEDAIFWLPAWKSEDQITNDPEVELSLIYYDAKSRLAERVWRIKSGQSRASLPLARTMHAISNFQVENADNSSVIVKSNFTVHCFDPKTGLEHVRFGFYEHILRNNEGRLEIARKHIVLLNDRIPSVLDFYTI